MIIYSAMTLFHKWHMEYAFSNQCTHNDIVCLKMCDSLQSRFSHYVIKKNADDKMQKIVRI